MNLKSVAVSLGPSALRPSAKQAKIKLFFFFLAGVHMAPFGVQRELVLLGHYFCTCWISRGAGQPGWNSFASWVHGDAIKKSLWPKSGVISLLHRPNKRPHSPPFL